MFMSLFAVGDPDLASYSKNAEAPKKGNRKREKEEAISYAEPTSDNSS